MSANRAVIPAILFLSIAAGSEGGVSVAVAGDDAAAARDHTKRGSIAYDLGQFAEAANEFELAYGLKQDPALLFDIAQAYRMGGQPRRAFFVYKAFLRSARPDDPNRPTANKLKEEMEQASAVQQTSGAASPPARVPAPIPSPAQQSPQTATSVSLDAVPESTLARAPGPLYTRWWMWTLVGVATLGVIGALVLTRDTSNPDCLGIAPCGTVR